MAMATSNSVSVKPRRGAGRGCRRARMMKEQAPPAIADASAEGSGTNAIWKLSIAIVSRAPVLVDADRAATRNHTLGWFDIAVSAALENVMGVVPQTPGSAQVAIVLNDVGFVPRPY